MIGRDQELSALVDRLGARRLVTVVGPGGIGKTALASVAADLVGPDFAYGAVTVDLTRVDRADGVAEAIAGQLGYADFDSLLDSPGDQPALIVVDNCEHVLDAAADAIDRMLAACRMPTVLATSRAPLDLPDESILALGPLAVPDDDSVELDTPAMQLLIGRVRDQGVDPDDIDATALAEICRRVDGVPLAIELAAARLRAISATELLTELDQRPHALARRRFRGQESHRSVAEVVGWSTDLLDDGVREVFRRLGVFAGPFTAHLAEQVVDDPDLPRVTDVLPELVDASLVVADPTGDVTEYRLLHPIRAVAVEALQRSGHFDEVSSRLVDVVVAAAVDVIVRSSSEWDADGLPTLLSQYGNIAAALRWVLEHDEAPERAHTLVAVLWGLVHQAHTSEIGALGEAVLARWDASGAPLWPDAVATVATCRSLLGRHRDAIELAESTLDIADRSAFAPATLRRVLAQTYRILGDGERSAETFAAGAELAAAAGAIGLALELAVDEGLVRAELGEVELGVAIVDGALAEARRHGAPVNEAWALAGAAHLELSVEPERAIAAATAAFDRSSAIGYPAGRSCSLRVRARARLATGDLAGASLDAGALLDELLERGGLNDIRMVLDIAAAIAEQVGDPRWVDLAVTARQLPITTVMVPVDPEPSAPAGRGEVLSTRDAYVLVRRVVAAATGEAESGSVASAAPASVAASATGDDPPATIIDAGDVWMFSYDGHEIALRASKGVADLVELLTHPGREISSLDLMGAGVVASTESEHLDATARRDYERRIRELQEDIVRAEDDHDLGTAEKHRVEMDLLVDQLTAAMGLGGRSRTTSDPAERARSAVTQRVRSTLKRVREHHPALGAHLDRSVTTGLFCRYEPDDGTVWQLG